MSRSGIWIVLESVILNASVDDVPADNRGLNDRRIGPAGQHGEVGAVAECDLAPVVFQKHAVRCAFGIRPQGVKRRHGLIGAKHFAGGCAAINGRLDAVQRCAGDDGDVGREDKREPGCKSAQENCIRSQLRIYRYMGT